MNLINTVKKFDVLGEVNSVEPYGDGHINDTYKVTCFFEEKAIHYILQRINNTVFPVVEELMENIDGITNFLNRKISEKGIDATVLKIVRTLDGKAYYKNLNNEYFRVYDFIENATGYLFAESNQMLYEAGKAFGEFTNLLEDYPVFTLNDTIKNFHNTPDRYKKFIKAVEEDRCNRRGECEKEIAFVKKRADFVNVISEAISKGEIPLRVTHNDTKINNVLIDNETKKYVAVIDLDTVMAGSLLYDYGDAIRSCGSTAVEDEEELDKVKLDLNRIDAYTDGYLTMVGPSITKEEFELLPIGAIMMTLECGMRFLTDHLEGDEYFKIHRPNHNLIRARNQFKFVVELEDNLNEYYNLLRKKGTK